MVPLAASRGADVAILTASETPFDELARFRHQGPLQETLPDLCEAVVGPEA